MAFHPQSIHPHRYCSVGGKYYVNYDSPKMLTVLFFETSPSYQTLIPLVIGNGENSAVRAVLENEVSSNWIKTALCEHSTSQSPCLSKCQCQDSRTPSWSPFCEIAFIHRGVNVLIQAILPQWIRVKRCGDFLVGFPTWRGSVSHTSNTDLSLL